MGFSGVIVDALTVAVQVSGPGMAQDGPDGLQKFMPYRSFVQDAQDFAVVVADGAAAIGGASTASGAAICSDAFSRAQLTNAAKELPIWHWYAMEHVANPGCCDYIGSHDCVGYGANPTAQAGADFGTSYIPPMIELNDDKTDGNDPPFVIGKAYDPSAPGEQTTTALKALFNQIGIAIAATDPDPKVISADDPAWKSYRLKGTQSSFTIANGIPTGMGATITEGGFVNSVSRTTCQSPAGGHGVCDNYPDGPAEVSDYRVAG